VLVERVLCNLIENAAKYSPAGAPIEIAARDRGDHVDVSIRDQGPGVDAAQRVRIFEMFVRGDRESARPGVGLGLAIARAIVECHGGCVAVANEASGGARFTFSLPKGDPPAVDAEVQSALAP
jgi:two-component system sensor histidine kinase KdpD